MKRILGMFGGLAIMSVIVLNACSPAQITQAQTYCNAGTAIQPKLVTLLDQFGVPLLATNQAGTDATALCALIDAIPATPAAGATVTSVKVPGTTAGITTPAAPAVSSTPAARRAGS